MVSFPACEQKSQGFWHELGDLFYRGQFSQVIAACDEALQGLEEPVWDKKTKVEPRILRLLKALALLEQHQVDKANEVFSDGAEIKVYAQKEREDEDFFLATRDFVKSKIQSHKQNFAGALSALAPMVQALSSSEKFSQDEPDKNPPSKNSQQDKSPLWQKLRYLCVLEYAETCLSLSRYSEVESMIHRLEHEEPFQDRDVKLAFLLLRSRACALIDQDETMALSFAQKCYGEAVQIGWTYFSGRAQILMAQSYKNLNDTLKYGLTLSFLQLALEGSEHQFLTYRVNDLFKQDSVVSTPMEFDRLNKRIFISGQWLPLHDRSILFEFLYLLHEREEFTPKKTISERLWPHEIYKPRVHDPRIFDIAKRVRSMIEPYRSQPLTLLSGRMGYKLASH